MSERRTVAPRRPRPKGSIYIVRLRGRSGADNIRELRWLLKVLLRRHRIRCLSVHEESAA
jgi:hypothetical protein